MCVHLCHLKTGLSDHRLSLQILLTQTFQGKGWGCQVSTVSNVSYTFSIYFVNWKLYSVDKLYAKDQIICSFEEKNYVLMTGFSLEFGSE